MTFLVLGFLTSLVVILLVVRSAEHHGCRSADHDPTGPQKFHSAPAPSIGAASSFLAMLAG